MVNYKYESRFVEPKIHLNSLNSSSQFFLGGVVIMGMITAIFSVLTGGAIVKALSGSKSQEEDDKDYPLFDSDPNEEACQYYDDMEARDQ